MRIRLFGGVPTAAAGVVAQRGEGGRETAHIGLGDGGAEAFDAEINISARSRRAASRRRTLAISGAAVGQDVGDDGGRLAIQGRRRAAFNRPNVSLMDMKAVPTILPTCNSWYLGANIPGKPRVLIPYLGFAPYVAKCEDVVAKGYEGFALA